MNSIARLDPLLRGMAGGVVATVLMSAVMIASKRSGKMGGADYPPRKITRKAIESVVGHPPEHKELNVATVATHLAYGVAGGALFGLARGCKKGRKESVVLGIIYGLSIWVASYKGWVPALGIMPKPEHDHPGRVKTMVAAHVVYGGALGAVTDSGFRSSAA